jgi:CBS domain-containing protein
MTQEIKDALVRDYMTTRTVTLNQNCSILEVAQKMVGRTISSIAITDEKNAILGILTERDIVRAVAQGISPSRVGAHTLMTNPVISVSQNATIEEASRIMVQKKIRHLIVTDSQNQEVLGIITATDLARYLRHNLADEEMLASEVWELFF